MHSRSFRFEERRDELLDESSTDGGNKRGLVNDERENAQVALLFGPQSSSFTWLFTPRKKKELEDERDVQLTDAQED